MMCVVQVQPFLRRGTAAVFSTAHERLISRTPVFLCCCVFHGALRRRKSEHPRATNRARVCLISCEAFCRNIEVGAGLPRRGRMVLSRAVRCRSTVWQQANQFQGLCLYYAAEAAAAVMNPFETHAATKHKKPEKRGEESSYQAF